MSAFKRKRGAQAHVGKKAKKVKIVADGGEERDETEQERKNEVTIPPPVSLVSARACSQPLKLSNTPWRQSALSYFMSCLF